MAEPTERPNRARSLARRARALPRRARAAPGATRDIARVYARGVALISAAGGRLVWAYLGLEVVLVLVPLVQARLAKDVVDRLAAGSDAWLLPAAVYALTFVLPPLLEPVHGTVGVSLEDRAGGAVDRAILRTGERLPDLTRVERPRFHDELLQVREAAWRLPDLFRFLHGGVGAALTLAGLAVLLVGVSPWLPLVLLGAAVPHILTKWRMDFALYAAMVERSRAAREMDYCVRLATEPTAAKEVRVFGLGPFLLARYRARFAVAVGEIMRLRLRHLRVQLLVHVVHAGSFAAGLWYVADRARAGDLTAGDVALYVNTIFQFGALIGGLPVFIGLGIGAYPHLRALFRLLDGAAPGIALPPPGQGRPVPTAPAPGFALRGVSFAYPESTAPVLQDIVADLPSGRVTALVGANGAGKSTVVKLLTRMYDPTGGAILLDGHALAEYDLDALRARVGTVYQDFAQLSLSLRDNVAVGAPDHDATPDAQVLEAARWSGADEVAARLSRGWDTPLTRRFEGGTDLSGGEWQKVALARGVIRHAPILILDEPNAALDADAEHRLLERFRDLAAGRTVLLISHRLSTVRMADHILVLEGGRVTEAGGHDELVALGGRYAALFEMQAGRYREG